LVVLVWIVLLLLIVAILTTLNLGPASGAALGHKFGLFSGFTLQICMTAVSFAIAAFLFCVEQISEFPEQFAGWKTERQKELNEQINTTTSTDLKV
jgi:hypothetical protein